MGPTINKAELFFQMMKNVPGYIALDISQSLCLSKLKINPFWLFSHASKQWPQQHDSQRFQPDCSEGHRRRKSEGNCCEVLALLLLHPAGWLCSNPHYSLPRLFQWVPPWSTFVLHAIDNTVSTSFSDGGTPSVLPWYHMLQNDAHCPVYDSWLSADQCLGPPPPQHFYLGPLCSLLSSAGRVLVDSLTFAAAFVRPRVFFIPPSS